MGKRIEERLARLAKETIEKRETAIVVKEGEKYTMNNKQLTLEDYREIEKRFNLYLFVVSYIDLHLPQNL